MHSKLENDEEAVLAELLLADSAAASVDVALTATGGGVARVIIDCAVCVDKLESSDDELRPSMMGERTASVDDAELELLSLIIFQLRCMTISFSFSKTNNNCLKYF